MKPWLVQLLMCILRSLFGEDERAESFILSEVYEPIRTWLQVYKMQSLHVNSWQLMVVRTRPFLTFRGREGKLLLSLFFLKLAWEPSFAWRSKPFFPCTSKLKFYANRSRGLRVMIRHPIVLSKLNYRPLKSKKNFSDLNLKKYYSRIQQNINQLWQGIEFFPQTKILLSLRLCYLMVYTFDISNFEYLI